MHDCVEKSWSNALCRGQGSGERAEADESRVRGDGASGSWEREREQRQEKSREQVEPQGGSPLSNKLDCLHEKAERLVRSSGCVCVCVYLCVCRPLPLCSFPLFRIPLSRSLPPPCPLLLSSVLSCFVPAGYILVPLLFLPHRGLTVGKRRGNAAGMPGQPTACIPVQPTTLLSGSVQVPAAYTEARGSILSSRQGRTETCPLPVHRPRASQRPARTPERESKTAGELSLWFSSACTAALLSLSLSHSLVPAPKLITSCLRVLRCLFSRENAVRMYVRVYASTCARCRVRVLSYAADERARARCDAPRIRQRERRREDLTVSSKRARVRVKDRATSNVGYSH